MAHDTRRKTTGFWDQEVFTPGGSCKQRSTRDGDEVIDAEDLRFWVVDLKKTSFGDADLDGKVDFADFLALSANFETPGGWGQGDFNADGNVQFADFLLLSDNFGKSATAVATVLEPNTAMLLLAGLVGLVRRRSVVSKNVWLR